MFTSLNFSNYPYIGDNDCSTDLFDGGGKWATDFAYAHSLSTVPSSNSIPKASDPAADNSEISFTTYTVQHSKLEIMIQVRGKEA